MPPPGYKRTWLKESKKLSDPNLKKIVQAVENVTMQVEPDFLVE